MSKDLKERLLKEAEQEDSAAEQLKGCSFYGEWPGAHHLRRASLLRQAALAISERKKKA